MQDRIILYSLQIRAGENIPDEELNPKYLRDILVEKFLEYLSGSMSVDGLYTQNMAFAVKLCYEFLGNLEMMGIEKEEEK